MERGPNRFEGLAVGGPLHGRLHANAEAVMYVEDVPPPRGAPLMPMGYIKHYRYDFYPVMTTPTGRPLLNLWLTRETSVEDAAKQIIEPFVTAHLPGSKDLAQEADDMAFSLDSVVNHLSNSHGRRMVKDAAAFLRRAFKLEEKE